MRSQRDRTECTHTHRKEFRFRELCSQETGSTFLLKTFNVFNYKNEKKKGPIILTQFQSTLGHCENATVMQATHRNTSSYMRLKEQEL